MSDSIVVLASCICDLFHVGHLNYLRRAAALGDFLVVGVVTDELLMTLKGKPVIPFEERFRIVQALRCVNAAYARKNFDDRSIVEKYGVSVRTVGPEYGIFEGQCENKIVLEQMGVQFVVIPRTPDISTTIIRRRIRNETVCCSVAVAHSGGVCATAAASSNLGVAAGRICGDREK